LGQLSCQRGSCLVPQYKAHFIAFAYVGLFPIIDIPIAKHGRSKKLSRTDKKIRNYPLIYIIYLTCASPQIKYFFSNKKIVYKSFFNMFFVFKIFLSDNQKTIFSTHFDPKHLWNCYNIIYGLKKNQNIFLKTKINLKQKIKPSSYMFYHEL